MAFFGKRRSKSRLSHEAVRAEEKPKPKPYRHIPVHAARDALSQAPPEASKEYTQKAIIEQNKRRSISRHVSDASIEAIPAIARCTKWEHASFRHATTGHLRIPPAYSNTQVVGFQRPPPITKETTNIVTMNRSSFPDFSQIAKMPEIPIRYKLQHQRHANNIDKSIPEIAVDPDTPLSPEQTHLSSRMSCTSSMLKVPSRSRLHHEIVTDHIVRDSLGIPKTPCLHEVFTSPSQHNLSLANPPMILPRLEKPTTSHQWKRFHLPTNMIVAVPETVPESTAQQQAPITDLGQEFMSSSDNMSRLQDAPVLPP